MKGIEERGVRIEKDSSSKPTGSSRFLHSRSPLLTSRFIHFIMTIGLNQFLFLSAVLFAIGFFGVVLRKNTLVVFMCLELMLVASTIALVAFSRFNGIMDGNVFVFFILTVAAAEVAIGLAIIVALFRQRKTIMLDELNELKN